jgi:hypothetical protein
LQDCQLLMVIWLHHNQRHQQQRQQTKGQQQPSQTLLLLLLLLPARVPRVVRKVQQAKQGRAQLDHRTAKQQQEHLQQKRCLRLPGPSPGASSSRLRRHQPQHLLRQLVQLQQHPSRPRQQQQQQDHQAQIG